MLLFLPFHRRKNNSRHTGDTHKTGEALGVEPLITKITNSECCRTRVWLIYLWSRGVWAHPQGRMAALSEDLGSGPWEEHRLAMEVVISPGFFVSLSLPCSLLPSLSLSLPSQCAIRGWGIFLVWVFIFLIYKPRSWTGWYPRNLEVLTLKIPGSLVHWSFFMCLPWFWLTNVLLSVWQEIWYLVFILSYLNSLESPDRGLVGL